MRQKGDQFTNAPLDRHLFSFLSPGHPVGEQKTQQFFFVRHTGARATILRMESESYPPSPRIRFFVRFLCALRAPWRLNGEWNTNNCLCLRNTVVFCSPGRPIWRTKYECGALSPWSRFLFAIQAPWRLKYEWKNTVAQWSFLVRISSACLRMRISFGATTLRIPPEWYLRTRPEGVTHSPRRSYAFAPNDLRIRPEGVTHSPRRCYAFAPKVLRIRLGEQNTTIRVTREGVLCQKIRFLGQKLWPVARLQTHRQTHTHTEVLTTENPIRASAFQASACDLIWAVQ